MNVLRHNFKQIFKIGCLTFEFIGTINLYFIKGKYIKEMC